ncbi:SMC-Scp complex subunit ScpB [Methanosalsum natronophilum]|uniref:SMC-Scp complex subunit ScpB n=1 Tax=Methanosalsum natronophilum TaxID=768733 RepID=A0A3R7XJ55_9EURY|nr:SMC-Scp complex subunit ScpB [Methanosalsum natronophilum]MCS3923427.1 segregation and condensation protein B [Methanosalsum natronophilum]RQD91176.1 MAG: SMC-Scp complex subunit ScpB [Methanosalsum natronophilum]
MNKKEIIEASLFVSGEGLDCTSISKKLNISKDEIKELITSLIQEYDRRETGLEIIQINTDRFAMQVKPKYSKIVSKIAPGEIKPPVLRTLSMVAYHQPISQADLVDIRGNSVYDHVNELKNRGFINTNPHGRTKILQTTELFADYFGIESNDMTTIKEKIIELSRNQSGNLGLDRWLGRKVIAVTPMYESLMDMCGISEYRVINAYKPTSDEIDSLSDVYKLLIAEGYSSNVSKYYDGEIIEVKSTTFEDLINNINLLSDVYDSNVAETSIEKIKEKREYYVSKAMVIDKKANPKTDMISRILSDLHIRISSDGVCILPDYKLSIAEKDNSSNIGIVVPTHGLDEDLFEKVCKKYETIIDGLKETKSE